MTLALALTISIPSVAQEVTPEPAPEAITVTVPADTIYTYIEADAFSPDNMFPYFLAILAFLASVVLPGMIMLYKSLPPFAQVGVSSIAEFGLGKAEEKAKETDNPIDDEAVKILRAIGEKIGIISPSKQAFTNEDATNVMRMIGIKMDVVAPEKFAEVDFATYNKSNFSGLTKHGNDTVLPE